MFFNSLFGRCIPMILLIGSGVCFSLIVFYTMNTLEFVMQLIGSSMLNVHLDSTNYLNLWSGVAGILAGIVILYYLYKLLWVPLDRTRLLGDTQYITDSNRRNKRELVNIIRRQGNVGECPPVYPNGWFALLESRDLGRCQVKHVSALGLNLVVFRGDSGTAHVTDAYCPHLGTNMAIAGQVFGDCLECPFHGWRFRGYDGKCTHIPTTDKVPDNANIKAYNTLEQNGFIHIWFHAEQAEPHWTPPALEKITSGQWAYFGRTEHEINAHIQEVRENGADLAHLGQVYRALVPAGTDLRYVRNTLWHFGSHVWTGSWTQDADHRHIGVMTLRHAIKLFGVHVPILDAHVTASQVGPGLVYLTLKSIFGTGVLVQCLTPKEPLVQRLVHHLYMAWWLPPIIPKSLLYAEAIMVERDIMIWNHKRYERKPVLVRSAEDQLIAAHRRWYSQFYSPNSPKLRLQKDDLAW